MGVISDYAEGGAAQKNDSGAAPLGEGDPCPTCGSPMSKDALAKQAGFPMTTPSSGLDGLSTAKPKPDAPVSKIQPATTIIGTRA